MRLEQLQVVNYVQESQTVSVEITDDDERVYRDSVEVPSADEDTTEWGNDNWSDGAFEGYPTEAGAYRIRTWLDTQSRDEGRTVDLREYEYDCVEMRVLIGDPRMDLGSTLSIWRSFECSAEREKAE
ncbi:hypothetical protein C482_16588 [Natrialba chahannaoensis JCM 10990]|uniref:Uncharacterized protein n=2 Tax=Natrialba chahannaoensis TaxID=68911 RepID=M0AA68_9EURY|nr:hypothetical protein C482_16588 [Natrialba chahannaoensis JCM 10990]